MSYSRSFVSLFPGAVIVVTPCFIVPVDKFPYPTGMTGLSLFCHLIDTKFLIFTMGKASVLMVMCLAIERWFASVKPLQYRIHYNLDFKLCLTIVPSVSENSKRRWMSLGRGNA